jgi:hypothetical protein
MRDNRSLMVRHTGLLGSFIAGSFPVPAAHVCASVTKKCVLARLSSVVT